eukprot:6173654-Pleurochrysis_carterae.AAC.2
MGVSGGPGVDRGNCGGNDTSGCNGDTGGFAGTGNGDGAKFGSWGGRGVGMGADMIGMAEGSGGATVGGGQGGANGEYGKDGRSGKGKDILANVLHDARCTAGSLKLYRKCAAAG